MYKFKPSKKLTDEENQQLDRLESLGMVAPLRPERYAQYVELCKKAGRKVKAEAL